jgi:beta-lactamase class A
MIPAIKKAWLYTSCLFLLTLGCTSVNSTNNETSAPSGITIANADDTNKLRDRIEQISQAARGRVGVKATVLETGESVTLNGDQQFPMQSVYKFPIAMAVLAQVDQGKLKLDQKIRVEAQYGLLKAWEALRY